MHVVEGWKLRMWVFLIPTTHMHTFTPSRHQQWLPSFQGSTGEGSTSSLTHMVVLAGIRLSLAAGYRCCHLGFSFGQLTVWQPTSLRENWKD